MFDKYNSSEKNICLVVRFIYDFATIFFWAVAAGTWRTSFVISVSISIIFVRQSASVYIRVSGAYYRFIPYMREL